MSKVELLRELVSERLTAAAEEIFRLFERTFAEREEEVCRLKQQNDRQRRLLQALLEPEVRLRRTALSAESRPALIKEEEEQQWSCDGQLQPTVKSEADEEPLQTSQLHHTQPEHSTEVERDGEDGGAPPADPNAARPGGDNAAPDSSSSEEADDSDDDWRPGVESPAQIHEKTSEPEAEDDERKRARKPQTGLKKMNDDGVAARRCTECGRTSHVNGPSGEKPFVCSVCVRIDKQSSDCGKKTFGCSFCQRRFATKADAVKHVRTHTGEKPFRCSVCGTGFAQSTDLRSHARTHTGERPFACAVCGKRFIRRGVLVRHMRIHTGERPYRCPVCEARFSHSQTLLKHSRIHTGEKPYSCDVCGKRFSQKGYVTQHMPLHTGEKPFGCRVCGRKFTRRERVKKHKCTPKSNGKSKK